MKYSLAAAGLLLLKPLLLAVVAAVLTIIFIAICPLVPAHAHMQQPLESAGCMRTRGEGVPHYEPAV
jgi:hypothetical protein